MDEKDINYVLSLKNLENICRVCLLEEGSISLKAIAVQEDVEINVQEVFEALANTQIQEADGLPQHICSNCFISLLKAYEFIVRCQKSNNLLKYVKSVCENETTSNTSTPINYLCEPAIEEREIKNEDTKKSSNSVVEYESPSQMLYASKCKQKKSATKTALNSCTVCSRVCLSKYALKRHMASHNKEKLVKCDICLAKFANVSNLKRHLHRHSGIKPFICDICDKAFTRSASLKEHKNYHNGVKPYLCHICNETFYHLGTFKSHLMSHKGICRKYTKATCKICNSILASQAALYNHMATHGENFLCNICGIKLAQKSSFVHHYRSHTGERPFACDQCPKKFSYKQGLKIHRLIHTGDRPYKCNICSKMFTQHNNLKRHLRYHVGARPYCCPYCSKNFTEKANLTVHIRTHTGETPHVCSVCNRGFYDATSLKRHKRVHKENSEAVSQSESTE